MAFSVPAQAQSVKINNHDIGGVVSSPHGPEAGVWVIAETRDLATRYTKMVVTDDKGRYVVPDLPQAHYKVWVRGYGLIDSPMVNADPGKQLNLTAVPAPNDAAAAQYYPAIYWYAMLKIPGADQFGGKGDIPEKAKLTDWLNLIKNNGCIGCHQLGGLATRTLPTGLGPVQILRGGLGAARAIGAGRTPHGQHHRRAIELRADPVLRRLDRSHRRRRIAGDEAAASARHRAQCGGDDAGLCG